MTNKKKENSGIAIHCHHDILVEHCYNYKERVDYIKKEKPRSQQETRLRVFKMLPEKALKDTPKYWKKAYDDRKKANDDWKKAYDDRKKVYDDWEKANDDWKKVYDDRKKVYDDWEKANDDWKKVYDDWPQKSKDAFHKKWCGCKEWNGKELVF